MRTILACLLAVLLLAAGSAASAAAERPLTVLISIDGFRPDYLDRGVTPVLSRLAAEGVRGVMRPSFPTKTFPNHYTLVTGLRPDRHGIVENNMEDPAIPGVTFKMSNAAAVADRRWWDQGEPIWVAAERAGIITGTMFWPGSEAPIRGHFPRYWRKFDATVSADARVDQVLAWLDLPPAERPRLITLYFDNVDTAGHIEGPVSPGLNAAAAKVDAALGRLVDGLKTRGVAANLIVVADHGMAPVSEDRKVFIEDILPLHAFRYLAGGSFMTIYPAEGREAEVERVLTARRAHLQCWRKDRIPRRLRYGKNPRVAPIFCLAETGWSVTTRDYKPSQPERGAHGFDNASPEMRAIFVASGPAFRRGVRLKTFDNVSVYPLLAKLAGVTASAHDGKLADVSRGLVRAR